MKITAKTDVGKVRSSNQDSYAAGELPNAVAWAVVCDGMGGAVGGNVASSVAVKMISEKITSSYREGMSSQSIKNMLISAINAANISIYDMARSNENLHGMGTTVVTAIVTDGIAYVAHAGDSRAYMTFENEIIQLTKDHSVVQELVSKGELTADEAKDHPNKNIITRALGVEDKINVDFCQQEFGENSVLLMCTDGLTNYTEVGDIYSITNSGRYYEAAERLVNLANKNGGGDNITVVAIAY